MMVHENNAVTTIMSKSPGAGGALNVKLTEACLNVDPCRGTTPPVCHDGVRNCERREEAEGGAWGPRDSRAEIRFMTEASGAEGLA